MSACGSAGEESAEFALLRETLSAQLIESREPLWLEGGKWEIAPEPSVVLNEALEPIDAVMLSGRIVVLDRMLPGLLIYDSEGSLIASVGREGRGPGEFLRPERVFGYRSDSLGTYDAGTMRIDIRSSDGSYGRSVYVRPGLSRAAFIGALSDGSFVLRADGFSPKGRLWREPVELIRVDVEGRKSERMALLPGREFYSTEFRGRPTFGVRPFGRKTLLAAAGSTVAVHLQDDCSLAILGRDGRAVHGIRSPCVRRRITDGMIRRFQSTELLHRGPMRLGSGREVLQISSRAISNADAPIRPADLRHDRHAVGTTIPVAGRLGN